MTKLQVVERENGWKNYSIFLPKTVVELAGLKKGDDLEVHCIGKGRISVVRV